MHHPTDRMTHTTAFGTPVVEHWLEREIAQWVQPMKYRSDDPSHARKSQPIVHRATGRRIDPSWWTHRAISCSKPALHNWCNKSHGMYYPVCGMMHIKDILLLIRKQNSLYRGGFSLSLSEWSFNICPTPYNIK